MARFPAHSTTKFIYYTCVAQSVYDSAIQPLQPQKNNFQILPIVTLSCYYDVLSHTHTLSHPANPLSSLSTYAEYTQTRLCCRSSSQSYSYCNNRNWRPCRTGSTSLSASVAPQGYPLQQTKLDHRGPFRATIDNCWPLEVANHDN